MMNTLSLTPTLIEDTVKAALAEDIGCGDVTANSVIPAGTRTRVVMAAREEGVIAGLPLAECAFRLLDKNAQITLHKNDGAEVKPGDVVLEVAGDARAILAAERVALNFVGHLSGIATLTQKMSRAAGNHKARIAATRKTTPGLRLLEKYAVCAGGGLPHRLRLDDAILIKDNHIAIAGGAAEALRRAKEAAGPMVKVEIEVDTLAQLDEVLAEGGADIVMLDNMSLDDMAVAVARVNGKALVEASGGVTLARVPAIAATGVDIISCGALTHSAANFDVGLDFKSAA